jgi:DNA repair ATPase RecN|tara:strand:+ start:2067 stop:2453 length:387 start_codon:yes stop_codon:yes gene_type:complete
MNLKQLTQKIEEAIDTSNKAYDEMVDAEYNIDDAESYLSSCRDQVSDAKVTLNDATDELRQIIMDIETLEGFDVDKVKREAFEEIGGAIRDLVAQHIDKVVAQAVSAYEETDEPKKEPAKKSTETDNQ